MINGLPDKLQTLRLKSGYSQNKIAQKLGLSPSTISSYENGDRTPSVEILLALSYLYHCSTDFLLGRSPINADDNSSPKTYTLDVTGLSHQEIKALTQLIRVMKE